MSVNYSNKSAFVDTGKVSLPKSMLGVYPQHTSKLDSATAGRIKGYDFSSYKGSYGAGGGSSPSFIGGRSAPDISQQANLPMSSYDNVTPSANINVGEQRSGHWGASDPISPSDPVYSELGNTPTSGEYTYSDAQLFNQQLENAYIMKQLGYNVDFQNGEMLYSRAERDYLSEYGKYGAGQSTGAVYESDWLAANQNAYQPSPERFTYPPSQGGYNRSYSPRSRYNSRYYSNYSQRYNRYKRPYNGYNGYGRSYGNRYNGYKRYNGYNRYNRGYYNNGYRNGNSYYNRNRWYGNNRR